jgi:hypothetical protein
MGTSLSHAAPASHRITAEDRMERIGQLTAKQQTDALLWLAGYAPSVFDAVAEAVEPLPGDGADDPAPYCATCGADIGIFLKFGLDRRLHRHRPHRHRSPRPRPRSRCRLAQPRNARLATTSAVGRPAPKRAAGQRF